MEPKANRSRFLSMRCLTSASITFNRSSSHRYFGRKGSEPGSPTQSVLRCHEVLPPIELKQLALSSSPAYRNKRWAVLNELVKYESNYLAALQFLTYDILDELIKNDDIMPRSLTREIFAYLPEIRNLHQHFRAWLDTTVNSWAEKEMVGWFFGSMVEQPVLLKVYMMFINNYQHARGLVVTELAENEVFNRFMESKLKASGEKLSFEGYFLKPVQRMIHLRLQIKDMLKCTPTDHPDRKMLEKSLARAEEVMSQLDALRGNSAALGQLMTKSFPWGVPGGSYAHGCHRSQLLHFENLVQPVFDDNGALMKHKHRRIFLTNERVVCANVKNAPGHSFDDGDVLTLKWVLPLVDVEFQTVGADGLECVPKVEAIDGYMKMLSLKNDLDIVWTIKTLACSFHNSYNSLNAGAIRPILDQIDSSIERLISDNRTAEDCYDSRELLVVPKKEKYNPVRERKYLLHFMESSCKRRWFCNARMAQRALNASNTSIWWTNAEQLFATLEPVFVRTFSLGESLLGSKISCGCYCTPNLASPLYANVHLRYWLRNSNTLWVCAVDGCRTFITVFSHNLLSNTVAQRTCFTLEGATAECIVHIPEGHVSVDESTVDTVWIGVEKKLLVYSTSFPYKQEQLACVAVQGCPKRMLYLMDRIYVGMDNGNMLVYLRMSTGQWNLNTPLVVNVACNPIATLLAIGDNVYVAAGSMIHVFEGKTSTLLKTTNIAAVPTGDVVLSPRQIIQMDYSVNGVWIVWRQSSIISLYQLNRWKWLLDIDVAGHVRRFMPRATEGFVSPLIFVSTIMTVDNSLWIGTNVGLTLMMALPRERNVPLLADFLYGAKHAHWRNVSFLFPLMPAGTRSHEFDDPGYDTFGLENDERSGFVNNKRCVSESTADPAQAEAGNASATGERQIEPNTISGGPEEQPDQSKSLLPFPETGGKVEAEVQQQPAGQQVGREQLLTSVLIVAGGQGYVDWRKFKDVSSSTTTEKLLRSVSNPNITKSPSTSLHTELSEENCSSAQIVLWEKRLNQD